MSTSGTIWRSAIPPCRPVPTAIRFEPSRCRVPVSGRNRRAPRFGAPRTSARSSPSTTTRAAIWNGAEQAVDAATDAGGGVVLFGAATYSFDDTLVIDGNGVVLRGAGEDQTILRPAFSGTSESCGRVTPLVLFRSEPEELGVRLAADVARGSTEIALDGPVPVEVGDLVEVDGVMGQIPTYEYPALDITQDPSDRYR